MVIIFNGNSHWQKKNALDTRKGHPDSFSDHPGKTKEEETPGICDVQDFSRPWAPGYLLMFETVFTLSLVMLLTNNMAVLKKWSISQNKIQNTFLAAPLGTWPQKLPNVKAHQASKSDLKPKMLKENYLLKLKLPFWKNCIPLSEE